MISVSDVHAAKTVSQLGSVHAAAKALFKTQPAISQAVKRLEERLGFPLFDRSGYRLTLTSKGEDFLQQSETLLACEAQLREYANTLQKGQEASVDLAVWPNAGDQLFLDALNVIYQQFPETQVNLHYIESLWSTNLLMTETIDIAICPFSHTQKEFQGLEALPISSVKLVNVASPRLLAGADPDTITRARLSDWNQIILRATVSGHSYSFGADRAGRRWSVNDQRLMGSLIRSGFGWGLMPLDAVAEDLEKGLLFELNLPEYGSRMVIEVVIARVRERPMGPVVSRLWDLLSNNKKA